MNISFADCVAVAASHIGPDVRVYGSSPDYVKGQFFLNHVSSLIHQSVVVSKIDQSSLNKVDEIFHSNAPTEWESGTLSWIYENLVDDMAITVIALYGIENPSDVPSRTPMIGVLLLKEGELFNTAICQISSKQISEDAQHHAIWSAQSWIISALSRERSQGIK